MGLLAHLRDRGLRIHADAGRLFVEPRAGLTEELKATIRCNKGSILRELSAEAVDRAAAIRAATEAARPILAEYRAALVLGHLRMCCGCRYFAFGHDPVDLGSCQRFAAETAPFVPFRCGGFEVRKVVATT